MFHKSLGLATGTMLFGLVACSDVFHISEITDEGSVVLGEENSSSVISPGIFSSSSSAVDACAFELVDNLWYGPSGEIQVQTGLGNDTETFGYWFGLIDDDYRWTNSVIHWPVPLGNEYADGAVDPVVEHCGGICAVLDFEKSDFVGVGFSIVGEKSSTNSEFAFGDATSWGGVCVTYASESDVDVVMGENRSLYDFYHVSDFAKVTFPRSLDVTTKCARWSEFVDQKGYRGNPKRISTLLIGSRGERGVRSGINVKGVGRYRQLSNPECSEPDNYLMDIESYKAVILASSSSKALSGSSRIESSGASAMHGNFMINDVCSFRSVDNLWYGPEGSVQVETGLGNDTETYGYWFSIEDTDDSEQSRVVWPVRKGNVYSDDALDAIHEFCAGICAELDFESGGFAGVGFNIVGEAFPYTSSLATGDASAWGGLCVTYASESEMDVVMSNAQVIYPNRVPYMPKATLPRSVDLTTKCVEWDRFVSTTGYAGDPTSFASLLFVTYGEAGAQSRFNIVGLGRYQQLSDPECSVQENFVSEN